MINILQKIIFGIVGLCFGFYMLPSNLEQNIKQRTAKVLALTEDGHVVAQGTATSLYNGFYLTNYHVTAPGETILVLPYGETEFISAVLFSSDSVKDFSLLHVKNRDIPKAKIDMNFIQGEPIILIGNPSGTDFQIAKSEISSINLVYHQDYPMVMFSFECNGMTFGYSGGGVYNKSGSLIGVAELMFRVAKDKVMCAAIPIRELWRP